MNRAQVERYFRRLGEAYSKKCRVILTGAAAGALYGRVRATMDVDFAAKAADWRGFSKAVEEVSRRTGIAAQCTEDIDRWSSVTLMDYAEHTYLYKKYGSLELRLMEPPYWAIGKFSRYLDPDIKDLVKVFKKTTTRWQDVAVVAGKALRKSPKSTSLFLFKRQIEDFFSWQGIKVWGRTFDAKDAIELFYTNAGVNWPATRNAKTKKATYKS